MSKGLFVCLEGIDGSGKTTQCKRVAELLIEKGYKAISTQEPTRGKLGVLLREYLSDPISNPQIDALIFAADRIDHYFNFIKPKLEEGFIVISDRYIASSIVYQGSQNVDKEWIYQINSRVPFPDLNFYIDIPIETALQRVHTADRKTIEKFESEKQLTMIDEAYRSIFPKFKMIEIEGDGNPENISRKIMAIILEKVEPAS